MLAIDYTYCNVTSQRVFQSGAYHVKFRCGLRCCGYVEFCTEDGTKVGVPPGGRLVSDSGKEYAAVDGTWKLDCSCDYTLYVGDLVVMEVEREERHVVKRGALVSEHSEVVTLCKE